MALLAQQTQYPATDFSLTGELDNPRKRCALKALFEAAAAEPDLAPKYLSGIENYVGNYLAQAEAEDHQLHYRSPVSDRLLYYTVQAGDIRVESDIQRLVKRLRRVSINRDWFNTFFYSCSTAGSSGQTPFNEVRVLEPGELLLIGPSGHRLFQLDSIDAAQNQQQHGFEYWQFEWLNQSKNAVAQSIQDVDQAAIMLSSGLDSAGIAAIANKESLKHIKAFSWSFPNNAKADETAEIVKLANHLSIDLELFEISDSSCFNDIASWPVVLDAPYFNAFRRMKDLLYGRVAAEGYEVLLNGHCGDNLYHAENQILAELWRDHRFSDLVSELSALAIKHRGRISDQAPFRQLIKEIAGRAGSGRIDQHWQLFSNTQLNSLATERGFAGRFNLQRRHPYLHGGLMRLAAQCPAYHLNPVNTAKLIARKAFAELLPPSIIRQQRVGKLDDVFQQGLDLNLNEVREYLFRAERRWPEFIPEKELTETLKHGDANRSAAQLSKCLGFERWLDEWQSAGVSL